MKLKVIIILVVFLGIFLTTIGALFKIQHWPYGTEILTIGLFLEGFAILLGIWKIFFTKKAKTTV